MAIDDAFMEHLADLTDPGIHIDFGAAQAQRRFAAHRDAVGALTTTETPIVDIAHLVGIPAASWPQAQHSRTYGNEGGRV